MRTRWLWIGFLVPSVLLAQTPPGTDIYLVNLKGGETVEIGGLRNVTDRGGYDNQPFFVDNQSFLFTAIRDDGQADIFRYDLSSQTTTRLTYTQEAEYSPTPTLDGKGYTVVRVEHDNTQRLWFFPWKGSPDIVLPKSKGAAYYDWIDPTHVAMFVLEQPQSLQLIHVPTGRVNRLFNEPGRGIRRWPDGSGFVAIERREEGWLLRRIALDGSEIETITKCPEGSQDFAILADGAILMGQGSKLLVWRSGGKWETVADLSSRGIEGITRLAVSPDGKSLALVANR